MCKECGCGLPGENPVGVSAHHHEHDHGHGHGHSHDTNMTMSTSTVPATTTATTTIIPTRTPTLIRIPTPTADGARPRARSGGGERRTVEVRRAILDKNDRLAERNRGFFQARGLFVLNFLSSPGSGKTTFIREAVRALGPKLKAGVIVGDLATDNDAQRLRESGAPGRADHHGHGLPPGSGDGRPRLEAD